MSQSLGLGGVDPRALRALLARLRLAGQDVPSPSLPGVGWVAAHRRWRVQLPRVCGGGQHYFSPQDYGSIESALVQAQLWRDEQFERAGIDLAHLHARLYVTQRHRQRGMTLPLSRQRDSRGRPIVRGWWMESDASGRPVQRTVTRSIGRLRSEQQAWQEVEQIVRERLRQHARQVHEAWNARAAALDTRHNPIERRATREQDQSAPAGSTAGLPGLC